MAIGNYGLLKSTVTTHMFHPRFVSEYDNATIKFEAAANRRLRVRQMETMVPLTTVAGDVALPEDYLVWRTVKPATRPGDCELDYVHPAYLPDTTQARVPTVFTIEGDTFKARPVDDTANGYEFHYYAKIPSLVGSDANTNWLLTAYPDVYLEGVLVELGALGRNTEFAQLHKARRDELLQEIIQLSALTTGATSPSVRTSEYY
jgi:hypothetical protein